MSGRKWRSVSQSAERGGNASLLKTGSEIICMEKPLWTKMGCGLCLKSMWENRYFCSQSAEKGNKLSGYAVHLFCGFWSGLLISVKCQGANRAAWPRRMCPWQSRVLSHCLCCLYHPALGTDTASHGSFQHFRWGKSKGNSHPSSPPGDCMEEKPLVGLSCTLSGAPFPLEVLSEATSIP